MPEYAVFEEIPLTKEEVLACSFSSWYSKFSEYSFEAVVIKPVPEEFLEYLSGDSIRLAGEEEVEINSANEYSDWGSDVESDFSDDVPLNKPKTKTPTPKDFPTLHEQLVDTLRRFDVFPKLNWSAPKDARWIAADGTLKCHVANDLYLLLNASDHIADDLGSPFSEVNKILKLEIQSRVVLNDGTVAAPSPLIETTNSNDVPEIANSKNQNVELILKKYTDINPALEFRIYVGTRILGISQRTLTHFEFLAGISEKLQNTIATFFTESDIINKMNQKFILDIYIPRPYNKVVIVDVNPFSRKSDSLLFTWNELLTNMESEFRLVDVVGRFQGKEYSESQVPLEVVGAGSGGDAMVELAREWERLQRREDRTSN